MNSNIIYIIQKRYHRLLGYYLFSHLPFYRPLFSHLLFSRLPFSRPLFSRLLFSRLPFSRLPFSRLPFSHLIFLHPFSKVVMANRFNSIDSINFNFSLDLTSFILLIG